jgi:hypothetical protein
VTRGGWIRLAAVAGWLAVVPLSSGTASAQAAPVRPPAAPVVRAGDRAPEFSLAAGDGGTYSLAALHGKKRLVLIVFRGTW